jgi:hypothetical protein
VRSSDSTPGSSGITAIIVGTLLVSLLITLLFGYVVHWLPVILAIAVGLAAVKVVNG